MEDINKKIISELFELKDEKYREFQSKLCPNIDINNIIGVRIPKLRNMAKEIVSNNRSQEFLENIENRYYEESMLEGLVIGYLKIEFNKKVKYIENFVTKIDNWAICDTFSSNLKVKLNEKDELWQFLQKYITSKNEYEIRFIVDMWLFHFMNENYIDKIYENLNLIYNEKYYIRMAIAWLISIGLIKYEEKTLKFLKNSNLDDFTYNKALQKAIESYRISDKKKELYRSMKKK